MSYKVSLIILYDSENRLLLQHRTPDAKLLPDYWAFFGGGLKDGETPDNAVWRETFEELNHVLKSPQLILERDFQEDDTRGHLYIYTEQFNGDKASLKLMEGQGWGWFKESETHQLKMTMRDRNIIKYITNYLENNTKD